MKNGTMSLIKSKLQAASIHLSISVLVFLCFLYVIYFQWYPQPFFTAEGGWDGIKLMAAIDLVLGPSLTLIIFNHTKSKKEIIFDLSMIVMVQIGALIWGGVQVYSERPVALVFWENTFYTVTEDYYKKQNIELAELAEFSQYQPLLIFAETDHTPAQLEKIQEYNSKKIPPYAQVYLYKKIGPNIEKIVSKGVDYSLLKQDVRLKNISESELGNTHAILGKAKYKNLVVYLRDTGDLLGIEAEN